MSGPGAVAAVLWDMDGLLVDSEPLWYAAESAVMAGFGGSWTPADQAALLGRPIDYSAAYLAARAPGAPAPGLVIERLLDQMADRLRAGAPLRPGAASLLDQLAGRRVPCALVSSSFRRLVDLVLGQLPGHPFAVSVAGDEVTQRKPHPEPYLTAARRLGFAPWDCLVLEDSPPGVAAAEAAGCRVLAVPDLVPIEPAPGRCVVGSLAEVDLRRLLRLPA